MFISAANNTFPLHMQSSTWANHTGKPSVTSPNNDTVTDEKENRARGDQWRQVLASWFSQQTKINETTDCLEILTQKKIFLGVNVNHVGELQQYTCSTVYHGMKIWLLYYLHLLFYSMELDCISIIKKILNSTVLVYTSIIKWFQVSSVKTKYFLKL